MNRTPVAASPCPARRHRDCAGIRLQIRAVRSLLAVATISPFGLNVTSVSGFVWAARTATGWAFPDRPDATGCVAARGRDEGRARAEGDVAHQLL